MKHKLVIGLGLLILVLLVSGITFSRFRASSSLAVTNQFLAKFVFEAEETDDISIPLSDLSPGDSKEYNFSVTNNKDNVRSNVSIDYQINLETFHFMPLEIKLYKLDGNDETLIMNCDESYSRNEENKLVCNSSLITLTHEENRVDDYKLVVTFDKEYNSLEYADLVDYIDINIKSFQKTD